MLHSLGAKILELDENSKGCCTSNLTRQILRKKRDGLLRLYPKIKAVTKWQTQPSAVGRFSGFTSFISS